MSSTSLKEEIEYLESFLESGNFQPFVITDPNNLIDINDDSPEILPIDLSTVKAGNTMEFLQKIASGNQGIVIFKNIDKISTGKYKDMWIEIIVTALKGESSHFLLKDKERTDIYLPFQELKVICTCSRCPEYLKRRGNLGVGPDFSDFTGKISIPILLT